MRALDRRTCAFLKAATIEAEEKRKPPSCGDFAHNDKRKYGVSGLNSIKMTPAQLDQYLAEKSKTWGWTLQPVKKGLYEQLC